MSGTSALAILNAVPDTMWNRGITAAPDLDAQLERAREFGITQFNHIERCHQILDQIDPDPEFAEPLPARLSRVLGLRLPAPNDCEDNR
jgi:hypothetical protein